MSDRLKELEQRVKCFNSETISFDEVRNWPEGELDELVSDRVLEEIELSKTIMCDQCPDHCTIEPERRTIPQTGEVVGFHVCREKPDGERQIIKLERFKQWRISKDRLIELGYGDGESATTQTTRRKTRFQKTAAIAKYLEARPTSSSKEVGKATGIDDSDVRHLWGPIKRAVKEGKSPLPDGYKYEGRTEAVDLSASCKYCREPLVSSFECNECRGIIVGECKTCHFTQSHPEKAVP